MTTAKDPSLILEVNLECEKCCKKIQKLLCKLQKKENIKKIDYENSKNKVTITGPFDPKKLSKVLMCKACDLIKDIDIVMPPKEEKKPKPAEEKKKAEEKKEKPEEKKEKPAEEKKKPAEEKKGEEKAKPKEEAKPTPSSTTTVNLQFTNICGICYPWPCRDPAHWGGVHQPQPVMPQWPPCEPAAPVHHHPHPPYAAPSTPKWSPCGGPPFCGGCGWCHGGKHGGWAAPPQQPCLPQPMCCPGPSLCRGCNGCKIVHETKFSYEEYPSSACSIM